MRRDGNERNPLSSPLDCDVGLGLKMQGSSSESSYNSSCSGKRAMSMAFPLYHCSQGNANVNCSYGGDGSGGGGGPFFSNQVSRGGDIYQAVAADTTRTFHNSVFRASGGGGMAVSGKDVFTASQLVELERQKMIHKYMVASIPVPPELLLPVPGTPSLLLPLSQSNNSVLELRFPPSGSDPEPWRCKRTDGKKWRCSRDVAPDQKYCERHAHKSRPRSRKPVEVPSHNTTTTTAANGYTQNAFILPSNYPATIPPPSRRPTSSQFPTFSSATSYDQTRCMEWLMRGGSSSSSSSSIPVSTTTNNNQQWQQQVVQTSSSSRLLELNNDNNSDNQPQIQEAGFLSPHPYSIPADTFLEGGGGGGGGRRRLSVNGGGERTQTTRHFIDAWEKLDGISTTTTTSKDTSFTNSQFSPSSLTLSMSGIIDEDQNGGVGGGFGTSDRDSSDGVFKTQWMMNDNNPVCWMMNSSSSHSQSHSPPPGGPLGEALCLGNANTTRGNILAASPHHHHGYNSYSTNSSSCSKSSCEDGSHALNFIG